MKLNWSTARYSAVAKTPRGDVRITHTNFKNLGMGWLVRFPDGRHCRQESMEAAKRYAEDLLGRGIAEKAAAVRAAHMRFADELEDQEKAQRIREAFRDRLTDEQCANLYDWLMEQQKP